MLWVQPKKQNKANKQKTLDSICHPSFLKIKSHPTCPASHKIIQDEIGSNHKEIAPSLFRNVISLSHVFPTFVPLPCIVSSTQLLKFKSLWTLDSNRYKFKGSSFGSPHDWQDNPGWVFFCKLILSTNVWDDF